MLGIKVTRRKTLAVGPTSSLSRYSVQDKSDKVASKKLRQIPAISRNKLKYQYSDLPDLPENWKYLEKTHSTALKKVILNHSPPKVSTTLS